MNFNPLYCIVLYTYRALVAVHTNHKCLQCERPLQRDENSLERTKRGTWLTVNKEELVPNCRASDCKGLCLAIEVLARRTKISCWSSECSGRREKADR